MGIQVFVGAVAVVAAIPLLVWSLHGVRPADVAVPRAGRRVRANLRGGAAPATDLHQVLLTQPVKVRVVRPFTATLARTARRVTPSSFLESLERRRALAGLTSTWSLERILALKGIGAAVGGLLALLVISGNPSATSVLVGALMVGIGFFLPDVWLSRAAEHRQDAITRALPDTIDQITICVEAGLGFEAAMARAARTGDGPLADELRHTLQDIQIGVPRLTALDLLLERTDAPDLRHFVVAVTQAEKYGVPIAQILRVQATDVREKRRFRAEERAQKLPVKLLFPLVFCIMPVLFIVLVGPAAIRIAHVNWGS